MSALGTRGDLTRYPSDRTISSTIGASIRIGSAFADQFIGTLQANSPPNEHECFRNPRRFNEISIRSDDLINDRRVYSHWLGVCGPIHRHAASEQPAKRA